MGWDGPTVRCHNLCQLAIYDSIKLSPFHVNDFELKELEDHRNRKVNVSLPLAR